MSFDKIIAKKQKKIILEDEYAMIITPSGGLRIIQLRRGGTISLGKFGQFLVDNILGFAYGQSFEILEDRKVRLIKSLAFGLEDRENSGESKEATPVPEFNSSVSNKNLHDRGSVVQKLTTDEIEKLKQEGGSNEVGKQIIERMIQSHEAFDKKTIFSQEKYLTRKQMKFTRRFTIQYLSSSNMLNYLYEKDPSRVLDMSEETLGLLMSQADVMPGGNYLVVDETGGLIVYAMLERMQGKGSITLLHENDQPKLSALLHCGYTEDEISSMVSPLNLLQFFNPENERIKDFVLPDEEVAKLPGNKKNIYLKRLKKYTQLNSTLDLLESNSFDGFICVSTLNPITLIPKVLPRISGSKSIVVYSQYKEILVGLNHALNKDKRVLMSNIFESKVRKYQTIPGKLHPLMTSRGGGGYVFWGLRVLPKEGVVAVGRGMNKGGKKQKLNNGTSSKVEAEEPRREAQIEETTVEGA